jgi:pimeloyl-ACP methyl ester carboxylesterase
MEIKKAGPGGQSTTGHTYVRYDTRFLSKGTRCAAWLYRPDGVENPPIVVLAHGFGAFRDLRLDAYASRFAQAGYAALVFDYRSWGASDGEPRRVLDIGAQHADWRAAVAYRASTHPAWRGGAPHSAAVTCCIWQLTILIWPPRSCRCRMSPVLRPRFRNLRNWLQS